MQDGPAIAPQAAAGAGRKRMPVLIHWTVSSFSGWGVYGLNIALAWANDKQVEAVCSRKMLAETIQVDPLRARVLAPFLATTRAFHAQLQPFAGQTIAANHLMLAAVHADFGIPVGAHDVKISGQPTIAVTFFETARFTPEDIARAATYPLIVTGSTWNTRVLAAHGLTRVQTVLQGIDPTLFHPAPRAGHMGERFCVFSGGKLEYRKGQDIAVAAFARFARRHPDALLVSAWHNPWPELVKSLADSRVTASVPFTADGRPDVQLWTRAAGIPPHQFLDLGAVPNAAMPTILREMDVAVFPNRCEGGTNLVAMECMACGVPTILSANTGHLDLIDDATCFPLLAQAPHAGMREGYAGAGGWGESDVDEVVEALERAYADRAEAARRAQRGAALVAEMTWARTAARTKQIVLEYAAA